MPDRLQTVFNQDGVIDLLIRIDGAVRTVHVSPAEAPWDQQALEGTEVKIALFHWMVETNAEGWIGARELMSVLSKRGVDVDRLIARFPKSA